MRPICAPKQAIARVRQRSHCARLRPPDVVPSNAVVVLPFEHGSAGQLGAIVADDCLRSAMKGNQSIKLTRDPEAGDRGVGDQAEAFAREVVDHGQNTSETGKIPFGAERRARRVPRESI